LALVILKRQVDQLSSLPATEVEFTFSHSQHQHLASRRRCLSCPNQALMLQDISEKEMEKLITGFAGARVQDRKAL
jgi:cytochrome c-type biogenesis protein CcmH/NrfF